MATYNTVIKKRNATSNGWDNVLPITTGENVLINSVGDTVSSELEKINSNYKKSKVYLNVREFGAKGDGVTDDTIAIQNALNSLKPSKWNATKPPCGGVLFFPEGQYIISDTIYLPAYTKILGCGVFSTEIYLANDTNKPMLKTDGYDEFLNSGLGFYDTSGVPMDFGIQDISFNGNRWNNVNSNGIMIYGYNYNIENVMVIGVNGSGFVSSHSTQEDEWITNKCKYGGTYIKTLYIVDCMVRGFNYTGPTDANIDGLFVNECKGDIAVNIETSVDVNLAHIFANNELSPNGIAVVVKGNSRFTNLISEHNYGGGLYVDTYGAEFTNVQLYRNCRSYSGYNMSTSIDSRRNIFGNVEIRPQDAVNGGGVEFSGEGNHITSFYYHGDEDKTYARPAIRLNDSCENSRILSAHVFNVNNGIAVEINQGGQTAGNYIKCITENCLTGYSLGSSSNGGSHYDLIAIRTNDNQRVLDFDVTPQDSDFWIIRERTPLWVWKLVKNYYPMTSNISDLDLLQNEEIGVIKDRLDALENSVV